MFSGTNRDNAVEAGKISNQLEDLGVKSVLNVADEVLYVISGLRFLCEGGQYVYIKSYIDDCTQFFTNEIKRVEEKGLLGEDLTIMKFLHFIIEKEFKSLSDLSQSHNGISNPTNYGKFYSTMISKLKDLTMKTDFLKSLKEKKSFSSVLCDLGSCKWYFYALVDDKHFKQYVDGVVGEGDGSFKSFKEDVSEYMGSMQLGKKVVNQFFEGEGVDVQAYYERVQNSNKALYINFVDYYGGKPIRVSDILQSREGTRKLSIYCDKKREVRVYQGDKKRSYKFEKGACYQMTSTWPIKDKSGEMVTCTMVMNVGSDGITEILKFNGKEFKGGDYTLLSEEDMELIKRNEELYIQGSPLCKAVGKLLKLRRGKEAVCGVESIVPIKKSNGHTGVMLTTANSSSQDTEANRGSDEKLEGQVLENSGATTSAVNNGASIPTEVNLRGNGTQTGTDLQQQRIELAELRKELSEIREGLRLMRNSEDAEGDVRKLQGLRVTTLEREVEYATEENDRIEDSSKSYYSSDEESDNTRSNFPASTVRSTGRSAGGLKKGNDKMCENISYVGGKITGLGSQLERVCSLLSGQKQPHICINSDSGFIV